jgi:hypothetical protein
LPWIVPTFATSVPFALKNGLRQSSDAAGGEFTNRGISGQQTVVDRMTIRLNLGRYAGELTSGAEE